MERSFEERALINPAFCAALIWHAARGHASTDLGALMFEESFLILPMVLHKQTRLELPRDVRTSLAVWIAEHSLSRGYIANGARQMVDATKEALILGGSHGVLRIDDRRVLADMSNRKSIVRSLKESSDEVRECAKRAEFVGKWFARAGSATVVLALLGVRP